MSCTNKIFAIIGPTAVGKTKFALAFAEKNNAEIINFDSRQIYTELNIGVAKPTADELLAIPHHLIGHISIQQPYSVADYIIQAYNCIQNLTEKGKNIVLVGGTGLYLKALEYGLDQTPEISAENRQKATTFLNENPKEIWKSELEKIDQNILKKIDYQNPRRVQRVLEIYYQTGDSILKYHNQTKNQNLNIEKFVLEIPREQLYDRINQRVDKMIELGLENEVRNLLNFKELPALKTVGYSEWWPYFYGEISKEQVIEAIKQHSRNYAKRQLTWCRKFHKDDKWIDSNSIDIR